MDGFREKGRAPRPKQIVRPSFVVQQGLGEMCTTLGKRQEACRGYVYTFELTVSNAICSGSLRRLTSYILLGGLSEYGSNKNDPKWNPRGILASSSEPAEPSPFKPKTSWALARACSGLGLGFRFDI